MPPASVKILRSGFRGAIWVVALAAVWGCREPILLERTARPPAPVAAEDAAPDLPPPRGVTPLVLASGLETPWALAFAPDGRIFVTERPGRIRVIEDGVLRAEPWAVLNVAELSEAGLMGLALAPNFANTGYLYVVGTFLTPRRPLQPRRRLVNRVVRLTDHGGYGSDPVVVVDNLWTSQLHAGGALGFGPDGMLYLSVGDGADPPSAQDPAVLRGKLLRYRPDGGIPADNPLPDSPVFARGFRNIQGFAWLPGPGGELLAIDHGPTGMEAEGGRTGDDELNLVLPGRNYGWPEVAGVDPAKHFQDPLTAWTPGLAPGGLTLCPAADSDHIVALIAGLRGQQLRRVVLERGAPGEEFPLRVVEDRVMLQGELGRLRALACRTDGSLYLATSNRDSRGRPGRTDDRILLFPAFQLRQP
jgi:glucose/arabinose dehydrogenase